MTGRKVWGKSTNFVFCPDLDITAPSSSQIGCTLFCNDVVQQSPCGKSISDCGIEYQQPKRCGAFARTPSWVLLLLLLPLPLPPSPSFSMTCRGQALPRECASLMALMCL